MKHALLGTLLFILSAKSIYAQTNFFVKIYHNTDVANRIERAYDWEVRDYIRNESYQTSFNRISVGVGILTSKRWNHELELSYTNGNPPLEHEFRRSDGHNLKSNYYSLQYELNKMLSTQNRLFQFSVGMGLNNYWNKMNRETLLITREYSFYERNIGATLNVIPRISYHLFPRFYLDFNIKFGLLDIRQYAYFIYNYQIPEGQRFQEKGVSLDFLPSAYNLRFGLSYKIK